MKFDIVNDYGALEPAWLERLEEILPLYAEQEGLPDALVIGLTFCDDDAIRAIKLISQTMANAVLEGKQGEQSAEEAPVEKTEA